MKYLIIFFASILFAGCHQAENSDINVDKLKIESTAANPCIDCTQKIQAELAICLKNAGSDQAKVNQCNSKASVDWVNKCKALCNPGIDTIKTEAKALGGCKKCSCPSLREDVTSGTCVNIRPPTQKLCGHTVSEHN